jgi:hypothetical protein
LHRTKTTSASWRCGTSPVSFNLMAGKFPRPPLERLASATNPKAGFSSRLNVIGGEVSPPTPQETRLGDKPQSGFLFEAQLTRRPRQRWMRRATRGVRHLTGFRRRWTATVKASHDVSVCVPRGANGIEAPWPTASFFPT